MVWDATKSPGDLITAGDWNDMVADQKGRVIGTNVTEAIADTSANLPSAGSSGRLMFETDTGRVLYDNGTSLVEVGLSENQISATNLDGSQGTSGQLLQTDGTNLSFVDITGGMTNSERQAFNDAVAAIARNEFANNLSELNYDGGLFTIYRDLSKIASSSSVNISTLSGVDSQGKAELVEEGSFDVSIASFNDSFDVSGQDTGPQGVAFSDTGDKMFVAGSLNDNVYEYSLSTSFDVSTASFNDSFDVSGEDGVPRGVAFSDSGDKMFFLGSAESSVYEYSLSTSFDISTASFNDSFDVSGQDSGPSGVAFSDTGDKMFVIGFGNNSVYEYSLSTSFDISTASFNDSFDVSGQTTGPQGVSFSETGDKMFVAGNGFVNVYEYSLSTSFDVSTASFNDSFDVSGEDGSPRSVTFNDTGDKMFVAGSENTNVYEYNLNLFFPESGTLTLISKDLSVQENGGFSSPPTSAVVSQEASLPTNTDIQYTLRDGNGNTVKVTQSDVDTQVDTSNFTSTTVEADVNLSQSATNDDVTPTSDDVMIHFKE